MREATDLIRNEVGHMMKDVKLLGERVKKLQTHFGQANDDLTSILTSTSRIEKRAGRIEELEFDGDEEPPFAVVRQRQSKWRTTRFAVRRRPGAGAQTASRRVLIRSLNSASLNCTTSSWPGMTAENMARLQRKRDRTCPQGITR